jgi:hypothetical protein
MDQSHRFWWRVVHRYDDDAQKANILGLSFIQPNGSIRLRNGFPAQRKSYRALQEEFRSIGIQVSPTRVQQLANEALAHATFAYFRSVIPAEVDRSVIIDKLIDIITDGRREKENNGRVKENGVHRVIDEVHLWPPPAYARDSARYPSPEHWPGQTHGFIMDWLRRQ